MNTLIRYIHIDQRTNTQSGPVELILPGTLTMTERNQMLACLVDGTMFVPKTVELPVLNTSSQTDWHILLDVLDTPDEANSTQPIRDLYDYFLRVDDWLHPGSVYRARQRNANDDALLLGLVMDGDLEL